MDLLAATSNRWVAIQGSGALFTSMKGDANVLANKIFDDLKHKNYV